MAYSHHEACPKCQEVGGDKSGNNLARYTNGSAFCFSCRHIEWPTGFVPSTRRERSLPPDDLSNKVEDWKGENWSWLRQYLEPNEILEHFKYSQSIGRHVYQHGDYWEARSVFDKKRKTLSHGEKPFILFGSTDPIVVVEDVVSAIKLSRVGTSLPLFGSHLSGEWMVRLIKLHPSSIKIWLDSDKRSEARKYASKINTLAPIASTIETDLDPKCYTTEQIMEYLK